MDEAKRREPETDGARAGGLIAFVNRLSDERLALLISAVLFVVCAWPIALTEVPPYQDVPNHLAVTTIVEHPELYPEFVFNGLLKTNAAFYAWDIFVGRLIGSLVAVRIFALIVLAANALVFPRLLLVLGDRRKLIVGSFFLAPMVHNWCVSMGLLDFALGVPLSLVLVILLQRQRGEPTIGRAALIAFVSVVAWYVHIIPLVLIHVIVLIELLVTARRSWPEAWRLARWGVIPMLPGTALALASVAGQLFAPAPLTMRAGGDNIWLAPWDLAYNLWAEWFYGFTWLSAGTLVPCIVLAVLAYQRRGERIPFFEPAAFLVLMLMYTCIPYVASYWAYANTRIEPLLWMAALLRVPPRLPTKLVAALAVCTVTYSASLGIDFVRLDRERKEFIRAIPFVAEHAKLLPMVFRSKGIAENTRPLSHDWGYYVVAKQTSAPLMFASSRLYGVTYREAPHPQLLHVPLERFPGTMRTSKWLCKVLREGGGVRVGDCEKTWREYWAEFWRLMEPRFDHVLLWDPSPEAEALVPASYRQVFREGRLVLLVRPRPPEETTDTPAR